MYYVDYTAALIFQVFMLTNTFHCTSQPTKNCTLKYTLHYITKCTLIMLMVYVTRHEKTEWLMYTNTSIHIMVHISFTVQDFKNL